MQTLKSLAFVLAGFGLTAASPQEGKNSSLTQGMVQMTLKVGVTDQAEVLEVFGGPNISTVDGQGQEVWVYDRQATVTSSSSSGFSIGMLIGGASGGGAGATGFGFGSGKSRSSQTQRTMTLIIKFDQSKKVVDFKSRSSSF